VIASAGRLGGAARVFRPSLAYLAPLAGAAVALALGVETRTVVAAVSTSAVVCALTRAAIEHMRIDAARQRADAWLAWRIGTPPGDELLRARIAELLDPRLRRTLARSMRLMAVDAASRGRMQTPAQHNRRVLREHTGGLHALSERLADRARPVSPRGMAIVHRLVTHGGSPLYAARLADEVGPRLNAALHALDLDVVGGREEPGGEERAA
jgi:hypothetical protein